MTVRRPLAQVANPMEPAPRGELEEARRVRRAGNYRRALALLESLYNRYPQDVRVWHEQAHFCLSVRQYDRAKAILESVAEGTAWREPQPMYQLGGLAERRGDYGEAILWYQKALRAHSQKGDQTGIVLSYVGMQNALMRLGEWKEAKEWTRRIVLCAKQHASEGPLSATMDLHSQFSAGLTCLSQGEWELGWKLYESRHLMPEHIAERRLIGYDMDRIPRKLWDGKAKERVLVLGEQGIGDIIMFSRYLHLVAARTDKQVVAVMPQELAPLYQGFDGFSVVTPTARLTMVQADSHCWIMSLPYLLGWRAPTFPLGYATGWPGLGKYEQPKTYKAIGICWHGERNHANDRDRSAPSASDLWEPLGHIDGVDKIVNLQYGESYFGEDPFKPKDYRETAQKLMGLSLVVTVDTSIAHLAGTLGVPTIVIPPTFDDFRWPRYYGGNETPWYPNTVVIRREKTDDWAGAMERVVRTAKEMLK